MLEKYTLHQFSTQRCPPCRIQKFDFQSHGIGDLIYQYIDCERSDFPIKEFIQKYSLKPFRQVPFNVLTFDDKAIYAGHVRLKIERLKEIIMKHKSIKK